MGGGASQQPVKTPAEPLKVQPQTVQQPKVQNKDPKPQVLQKSLQANAQSKEKLNTSKISTKNLNTTDKNKQKQKIIQPNKNQSSLKSASLQKRQNKLNKSINTKTLDKSLNKSLNKIVEKPLIIKPIQQSPTSTNKPGVILPQISSAKRSTSYNNNKNSIDKIVNKQISKSTVAMKALGSKLFTGSTNFNHTTSSGSYRAGNSKKMVTTSSSVKKISSSGSRSRPNLITLRQPLKNQQLPQVLPQNQQDRKLKTKTKSKKKKIDPKITQLMKLYGI